MRTSALLLCAVTLVVGCLKQPRVVQATTSAPVALVSVLDSYEDRQVLEADALTLELLGEELERRNLVAQAVTPQTLLEPYVEVRTTERRLELAAAQAGGAPLVLLVETDARFGAQVNGRYRWTVTADVSVAPTSDLSQVLKASVSVPVHLVYYHQKEREAVQEAAPVIARQAGSLLDEWIGLSGQ